MKAKTVSSLKRKADKIFSEWVRSSNADWRGKVNCFTCGEIFRWQDVDAGHFITRKENTTRYDPENVKPQCRYCNRFREGAKAEFALKLGTETVEKLVLKSRAVKQFKIAELEEFISEYKDKLKKL
ncbi:MAG TPA: hypothetical protein ENI23_12400 [bacterium]|nr:hypothetical protein [bacterium]